jgi:uncharacterized protein (DUF433 family)
MNPEPFEIREVPSPFQIQDGTVRFRRHRVPVDAVVSAFREGATPEEILSRYPSLPLADVYVALGYYLHYRDEVDAYVDECIRLSEEAFEAGRRNQVGLREELLRRAREMKAS